VFQLLIGCALIATPAVPMRAQEPALIPRSVLFGNPERSAPQISPDGTRLAYLAPDDGVLNVWVRTLGQTDDRPVTRDRTRPVRRFLWQGDSKHILHLQDQAGDENWRLYQTNLATGSVRDLTIGDSVQTQIVATAPGFPHTILAAWNLRDRQFHDVYRIDLRTGKSVMVARNTGDVDEWSADNALRIRLAIAVLPDGGRELRVRDRAGSRWRTLRRESADEAFNWVVGFTPDNRSAWIVSSVDANAARLVQVNLASGGAIRIAADPQFDVSDALVHPTQHTLQAVRFTRQRAEWQIIDSTVRADFETLARVHEGDFDVVSRSDADTKWIVSYVVSDGPVAFYVYDRPTRKAEFLFTHRPQLEKYRLAKMEPVSFPARDSLQLFGYLTLPLGREAKSLPLVLLVHGGPWGRDEWGFEPSVQWLANRGYAVLQINFRGSTGYGKAHLNAGDLEWGGKMHTDLLDGKAWAIAQGYADSGRVAIYGGSYGGYATLVGMAFTPDEFVCGVDIVGPSNLVTLLRSIPPYWAAFKRILDKRMGTDSVFLESRSPLFKADQIKAPLLIVQGANDPRVKQAESDQIVAAMRKNGKEVQYIVFPDEGHGFARPENRLKFYAAAEPFLAKYLGGRVEPAGEGEALP
jgi:dipeptidyl aminopeptidase/acylaminoacyl peptidase